jgi:protein SCO1/2
MELIKRFWFPGALVIMCCVIVLIIIKPTGSNSELREFGAAPDFELLDTEGKVVTLDNTKGKVRLVYFFFANCPDVCPPTTAMLSKLQNELITRGLFATETALLSITFDPIRDTTEQLLKYSANYNVDTDGWYFLRGEEDYTIQLAKDFAISVIKDKEGNFLHQNFFALVDQQGQIRAWYDANDLEVTVEQIADDMQSLI